MPKPYLVTAKILPEAIHKDFEIAKRFWELLPDASDAYPATRRETHFVGGKSTVEHHWSCHGVCRGAKRFLSLDWIVLDGWFQRTGFQHGWLFVEHRGLTAIIDMYPIGAMGGPMLLEAHPATSPWAYAYIERRMAYSGAEVAHFDAEGEAAAKAFRAELRKQMAKRSPEATAA